MAAPEAPANLELEIAHVLFIDVVGYSKLLINEQRDLLDELNQVVRNTEQFRSADAAGKLICLPTGDGMVLAFFTNPEAPVKCALEICDALKSHPHIQLRMGIHSGPISRVTDVNDRSNVAGAGINIAQRVMDCGDAGHILVSQRIAEDLAQYSHWRDNLRELGECEVKHGVKIRVTNLCTQNAGNPATPTKLQGLTSAKTKSARQPFSKLSVIVAAALVVAGIAAAVAYFFLTPRTQQTTQFVAPPKSIAVLPLENFSDDKENAFFADGIQDDILTSLAKIRDLRVISRTSVESYRGAKALRNLREIGRTLGVANILEGSVRRAGNLVVITVQLIDAVHDRHIWANRYERTMEDTLGLQGELAAEIASALHAVLSPEEKVRVGTKPTENADAYVFYLRATQIAHNPDTLLEDYKTAEELYRQAIALDPKFALAHARLASTCAEIFHYYEPTDNWKTKARAEADMALDLQPSLAEAHYALGQCIYWIDGDYERALQQLDTALVLAPNNGEISALIAAIKRRQGHWQESLDAYERAQQLDPQNPNIVRNVIFTNTALRRWPAASQAAARFRAMAPASITAKIQSGYIDFWWKGETALLKSLVNEVPAGTDPDGAITAVRWEIAMLEHDYASAQKVLAASPLTEFSYMNSGMTPKGFMEGCIALAQKDVTGAQKLFEPARAILENEVKEAPDSADRHANLGLVYAFMGRADDAIREGQRAVELKPESKDAFDGAIMSSYLALIYARVGKNDLAIPLLERLLKTPGAVDSADYSITLNDLRKRWEWDSIRNDPRFKKLVGATR